MGEIGPWRGSGLRGRLVLDAFSRSALPLLYEGRIALESLLEGLVVWFGFSGSLT